jgi:hypothetical protein
MVPVHLAFGGGAAETILFPAVAVWMLIAIAAILLLPRQYVIVPFLLAFFTIPVTQVIVVGGLHFPVLRVLILVGLVRSLLPSKSPRFAGGFNRLDTVVVLWTVSIFVINSLQWMQMQAFVKLAGDFLDALGGYLLVRFLIPDGEAIRRTAKVFAVICVFLGTTMMLEQATHRNVLDFLGAGWPEIREGHVRSQGVLGSIQSGTFGGVLIPLFLWLWRDRKSRFVAYLGLIGGTAMALASHASTSMVALGAGLLALAFWPLRNKMRVVRWGIVAMLVSLHLYMKGPVWSIIEHIDLTGGSSNYHRYMLVDNCIRHFWDWWLLGYRSPANWGFDMWDMCNQFVAVAVTGGLLSLILFVMIYSRGFSAVGKARKRANLAPGQEWFLWSLGAVLFANAVASFGINYMVQLLMLLFPLLACISVAVAEARQAALETAPASVPEPFGFTPGALEPARPIGVAGREARLDPAAQRRERSMPWAKA